MSPRALRPLRRPLGDTRRLSAGVAAVVAVLLAVSLTACGSDVETGSKGYIAGDGVFTVLPIKDREKPGTIAGTTLQGRKLDVADLTGKPVVINIWASWCPPCRQESPVLKQVAEKLDGRVSFVGINVRDPSAKANALAFERRFELPYPSLYAPGGQMLLAFHGKVTPYSIPSTIVLDSTGRIGGSVLGAVPSALTLEDLIDDVEKGVS